MNTYQEYATNEYNKNKKVLKPIDLNEVVNVKYIEVIKNFESAVVNLKQLNKLNKKLSTGSKTKKIDIRTLAHEKVDFSIVKDCPLGLPYYAFAIESFFFCCNELKAFDYWIGYATKIEILDTIQYAVDEGFYTRDGITRIIRKILENE